MNDSSLAGRAPAHDDHDGHDDTMQAHEGSLRGYLTGFVLAAILTIIPFWLVMGDVIQNHVVTIVLVLALALVQIVVHCVFFLHLNTHSQGGWNMLAFIFMAVLVVIVLGASIWVMYSQNASMMPVASQYGQQVQQQ